VRSSPAPSIQIMASFLFLSVHAASGPSPPTGSTCYDIKAAYKDSVCCTETLSKVTDYTVSMPTAAPVNMYKGQTNPCEGKKPTIHQFDNFNCSDAIEGDIEQSGTNVTLGYVGNIDASASPPITVPYYKTALCPVNVHWHLGAEHLSVGQYDYEGSGPPDADHARLRARKLAGTGVRQGLQCHYYDDADTKFTTPYEWKHCVNMKVGQTYEVHWPHSAAGACGTAWQYQYPFYDGVFCHVTPDVILDGSVTTHDNVGVQGQIFTIVNDESYYYPDMVKGMIYGGDMGSDMAYYTGSTTGTTRSNTICSAYSPITWQVDRKCHMISASSFDKMCADMKAFADDMSEDLHPHGARPVVPDSHAAQQHVPP